jgi:hypothetical protein
VTTDGGSSWSSSPVAGTQSLRSVSCGSPTTCAAIGLGVTISSLTAPSGFLFSGDGATTWHAVDESPAFLTTLACGSASHCEATGAQTDASGLTGFGTTDGGRSWLDQPLATPVAPASGIDCRTAAFCVAVGTDAFGDASMGDPYDGGVVMTYR